MTPLAAPDIVRQPSARRDAARLLWPLARPWWPYGLGAFGANVASALFEGSTIAMLTVALQVLGDSPATRFGPVGHWLDGARLSYGREHVFIGLVVGALLAQILRSAFQLAGQMASAHVQACVQAAAHDRIFSRIMRLPFARVSAYRLGDLTDYLGQTGHLHDLFGRLNELARNALFVAIYGVLLFWLSWPMTLLGLAAYWFVSRLLHWVIARVGQHARRFTASAVLLNQCATEFLQAIRPIHTFARQEHVIGAVNKLARETIACRRLSTIWSNSVEPITDVLTVAGTGAFLLSGYLMLESRSGTTLPHLLAFLLALYRVMPRLRGIYSSLAGLANLAPHVARMSEMMRENADRDETEPGRQFPGLREAIEFRGVTFRYLDDEPPALVDVSFAMPRGSYTALAGVSGTGKSTVADLLLRLFEPTSGQILVDGVDLKTLDPASWRERIGAVSQEPFLFHATVRDNIEFGKPGATREETVAAAKAAHADGFIARLSEGYETVVGDRGYRLSGGQCQRIALARALVRDPEILILDEATSALDSESERLIHRALDEQRGSRTILAIAHRLSTVARADQILVLEEGRLVEQGTHDELLGRNGVYARLWKLQSERRPPAAPSVLVASS